MPFPWDQRDNWEVGTIGSTWDSFIVNGLTTGNSPIMHYSRMAAYGAAPYRGAFALCIPQLSASGGTGVIETTDIDSTTAPEQFTRFMMWVSPRIQFTATGSAAVYAYRSSADAITESTFGLAYDATAGFIGIAGDNIGQTATWKFPIGEWVCVETAALLRTAAGGTFRVWMNGTQVADLSGLTAGNPVTSTKFGFWRATGAVGWWTGGAIVIDDLITHSSRVGLMAGDRFDEQRLIEVSEHAFVGSGTIDGVTLLSGGAADNIVRIYDTDVGYTSDAGNVVLELRNAVAGETIDSLAVPVRCQRGAYVQLSGTNPRALVRMRNLSVFSQASYVAAGLKWKPHPVHGMPALGGM